MKTNKPSHSRMTVTEVEEFLRQPPAGFSVDVLGSGHRVHSDPDESLVLIDDFDSRGGKVVFQGSLGRKVKMQNLWEYTSMRKSLLSKRIYLLVSACEEKVSVTNKEASSEARVPQLYVVSIAGSDPFIKWQMEKGLDWTISSVAGESYRVDIDLSDALQGWAATNSHIAADELMNEPPVWRDASFTLKYYSDALFDFPHWFGFSKRTFKTDMSQLRMESEAKWSSVCGSVVDGVCLRKKAINRRVVAIPTWQVKDQPSLRDPPHWYGFWKPQAGTDQKILNAMKII